eukprot:CAMPEP_0197823848 /NCGR_PEP_ID=MMETSP1437-20131217/1154_1 /TAXON_ID=49252 ORGANISM="Eucampia antarctica, Strain CCMP1452" /NCGR_SAMPLE_ID=MMETSP1437 /ASSEMBLY_ACC=CAM_ASM_001096 /LENGTH=496 /DNA_ID=CAMNT_0043423213 /DNA_START=57 /DNA_END=1547 /DNA_ORIENTATION=-
MELDGSKDPMNNDEGEDVPSDEPAFIDLKDTVEVNVDDTDVPMDEDDNEDAHDDEADDEAQSIQAPDMSIYTLTSHTSSVYAVAAHYHYETRKLSILTGGGDDKSFLHKLDATTSLSVATVQTAPLSHKHTDSVCAVAFNTKYLTNGHDPSKPGNYAAVGSYDGNVVLYDANTGEHKKTLDGPTDVEFLSFHPKGGSVLLAGSISDGTIWMYHLPTSKCLQVFVGHETGGADGGGGVSAGCFTPDGKFAVSTGMDGTMRVWAPRTGMCRHVFRLIDGDLGLTCIGVDGGSDGQLAIAGGEDGNAYVCHLQGKKLVATLRHFDHNNSKMQGDEDASDMRYVEAVAFAPRNVNPNWVATGSIDGSLKIWDLANEAQCRQTCKPAQGLISSKDKNGSDAVSGITRLTWHPSLPVIFVSYADGIVRLWDVRDGILLHAWTGGNVGDNQINDMAVEFIFPNPAENSAGTAIIVTANDDKHVKVYEVDVASVIAAARSNLTT